MSTEIIIPKEPLYKLDAGKFRSKVQNVTFRKAKQSKAQINDTFRGSSFILFEDLDIGFFRDEDANGRRRQFIEFQLSVSKEQQHLQALKQQAIKDQV